MLRNRNIAFFIDVDNVGLSSENFANILSQLEGMGAILTGKIYGAKERKHKEIYDNAELRGFKVERPMRIKRRGRKDFDSRIFVDVVDTVCHAPAVDTVCIVTASCDLVYLYGYLHGKGIKIISSDENEEASMAMVDEYVDLGRVYEIALPAKKAVKPVARTAVKPSTATEAKNTVKTAAKTTAKDTKEKDDNTDELLREIQRLRNLAEEQQAENEAQVKSVKEAKAKAEAEAKAREQAEAKAMEAAKAREEAEVKARAEAESKAAKAREEAEAKAREEEQAKAQKAIEEAKAKAYEQARIEAEQEALRKAKIEEEARQKAEDEVRRKLAELAASGGNNEELMRELEKLKKLTSETNQLVKEMKDEPKETVVRYQVEEVAKSAPVVKQEKQEEQPVEEKVEKVKAAEEKPVEKTEEKHDDTADDLMRQIEHWKSLAESQSDDDSPSVRTYYVPRTDGTLIKKIEEMHKNNGDGDSDELLDEIRKLLDGLD